LVPRRPKKSHFLRNYPVVQPEFRAIGCGSRSIKRETLQMRKTLCAGVFALAAIGLLSDVSTTYADEFATATPEQSQTRASINIVRIKSALRLTPEQEAYWPPVEAALRGVARQQAHSEPSGFVRQFSRRVVSIVLNSAAVERLAVAVRPLVAKLSEEQMRSACGLAREMGLGPVVMAALK
jgi:hypothetical protein